MMKGKWLAAGCLALIPLLRAETPTPWAATAPPPRPPPLSANTAAAQAHTAIANNLLRDGDRTRLLRAMDLMAEAGRWEDAATLVRQALSTHPDNEELLIRGTRILHQVDDDRAASALWLRLYKLHPERNGLRAMAGASLLRTHAGDAEKFLRSELVGDPANLQARYHMAVLELMRTNAAAAAPYLDGLSLYETGTCLSWTRDENRWLKKVLGDARYRQLAALLLVGGLPVLPQDLNDLTTPLLDKRIRTITSHLETAWKLLGQKDWKGAVFELQSAQEQGARAPALTISLAYATHRAGQKTQALNVLLQADNSSLSAAHKHLVGQTLLELNDGRYATNLLWQARAQTTNHWPLVFDLACAYYAANREEAWAIFESIPAAQRPRVAARLHYYPELARRIKNHSAYLRWQHAEPLPAAAKPVPE